MLSRTTLVLALLSGIVQAAPHRAGANEKQQQQAGGMSCAQQAAKATVGKAIYFLTNDAENAVVAVPIGADGMLSKGTVMKTGGAGSIAVDTKGKPATPDALVGQSALTVVGNVSQQSESSLDICICENPADRTQEPLRCQRGVQHAHHDGHIIR